MERPKHLEAGERYLEVSFGDKAGALKETIITATVADRPGLLSDVLTALQALDLEVQRSLETSGARPVTDTFVVPPPTPATKAEVRSEVRHAVLRALCVRSSGNVSFNRQRGEPFQGWKPSFVLTRFEAPGLPPHFVLNIEGAEQDNVVSEAITAVSSLDCDIPSVEIRSQGNHLIAKLAVMPPGESTVHDYNPRVLQHDLMLALSDCGRRSYSNLSEERGESRKEDKKNGYYESEYESEHPTGAQIPFKNYFLM
ncbi:hypothetical protein CYMTET_20676 [Cymbomonas tetramitiformis]|uniref:ACT domain-containing protein n=1 Tax=Cymbomonas tetramitiformis TaxID=36881 RepID=A0AAE0G3K3_9CHLO|nr:hypothetical protein CYMTET_20676 [Cymbomonas tetramitiformis]